MIENASGPDGGEARRVEAEEINSGLSGVGHIGAYVQLGKAREARDWGQPAGSNSAHAKRNDSDPAFAVEGVESQLFGNQRPYCCDRNGPMGEQQVVPDLLHDPRAGRQWPGTMRG